MADAMCNRIIECAGGPLRCGCPEDDEMHDPLHPHGHHPFDPTPAPDDGMVTCEGCPTLLDPEHAVVDVEGCYLCSECAAEATYEEARDA